MRILIVEDDPMVRSINKGFLRKMNPAFLIEEAENISSAKKILEIKEVQLVLLDVYLGEDHGPDLLHFIREQAMDVDVILITADNSSETVEHAFRFGSIDYLIKPFHYERFKEAVKKALLRRSQLSVKEPMDQSLIDAMIKTSGEKEKKSLEKGINELTYGMVLAALEKAKGPMTAQEIGEEIDLSRVTVRRYLEYLVEEGKALETQSYGKVGRPQKAYGLKDKGGRT